VTVTTCMTLEGAVSVVANATDANNEDRRRTRSFFMVRVICCRPISERQMSNHVRSGPVRKAIATPEIRA
jgi:hypothetical protein